VCVFNAVCVLDQKPSAIQYDMTQWWTEFGQKELFPQASFEITDEDYEDSDDDEDDEKVEATTAQKVDAEVSETMQDVEVLAGLEKEFQRVVEGEADVQLPDLDMDPDTDEETISDPDPKRSKPDETMGDVRTLKDALRKAGFQDYVPSVNSEKALNERMQRLFPVTMEFGVLMRLSDGILSRASVVGVSQKCRQNNLAEHALAVARAAHACHAGRQSRFALWAAYSDRCVEASEAGGAAKIVKIGPAVKPDASGFLPRQMRSPVVTLDAHDGSLVFEIPADQFKLKSTQSRVDFEISELALKCWRKVGESGLNLETPSEPKSKKAKVETSQPGEEKFSAPLLLTENDLGNNNAGRKNMSAFVWTMIQDFQKQFWTILHGDNVLHLPEKNKVPWEEFAAKIPVYFRRKYTRGSKAWKEMCSEDRNRPFGDLVLRELDGRRPTVGTKPKVFLEWLLSVHMETDALKA
ncbi:unnamed protein product, partial [Durusdinium trenchii]